MKSRIVTGGKTCCSVGEFSASKVDLPIMAVAALISSRLFIADIVTCNWWSHTCHTFTAPNHIQYNSPHRSKCLLSGTRTRFFHLRSAVISRHSSFPILSLHTASFGNALSYVGIHVRSSNNPLRHASIKCEISRLPQDGPTLLHV